MTKIAVCQIKPLVEEPDKNLTSIKRLIKKYSKKGIKLYIFPEDFLYGIIRGDKNVRNAGEKFPYWVKVFSNLAKTYKVDLIPGSFPLYEKSKLYNATVYINSQGKVLNKYCKTNLWLSERKEYSPSKHPLEVFNSVLGKTAIIICWDLMDHKLFEEAVKQKAEWIINISFWSTNQSNDLARERGKPKEYLGNGDSPLIDALVRARVYEYGLGIIFCNFAKTFKYRDRTGQWDLSISAGRSQIFSPLKKFHKKLNSKKEEILICDVPHIKQLIKDQEVFYGRREDVIKDYPYSKAKR